MESQVLERKDSIYWDDYQSDEEKNSQEIDNIDLAQKTKNFDLKKLLAEFIIK